MNGYENLTAKQSALLWDREKKANRVLDDLDRSLKAKGGGGGPCDIYNRCWECPVFKNCIGIKP